MSERRVNMEWVNSLSVGELREELARYVHINNSLVDALRTLPEMPATTVLNELSRAANYPEDWSRGKKLQREVGLDVIPPRTEYELGAGLWSRIRTALIEGREGAT